MQLVLSHVSAGSKVLSKSNVAHRRLLATPQQGRTGRHGVKVNAFFGKLKQMTKDIGGGKAEESEMYIRPESRECYTVEEAKEYYTITGIYAVEGSYDLFDKMVATGVDPVDLVLLMACSEGDDGKVEECLNSGAHPDAKDHEGRSALEIAVKDEIKEMLQAALAARV